jgi:hypothetical protein
MKKLILSVFAIVLLVSGLINDNQSIPGKRIYHSMAYDSESDAILLFGGQSIHTWKADLTDLWLFDLETESWEKVGDFEPGVNSNGAQGPAYDTESDRVIFLNAMGETWAYDYNQNKWQNMMPYKSPCGRAGQKMTYDFESDRIIMYGGFKGTSTRDTFWNETWAYNYNLNEWEFMEPDINPTPRIYHDMCYDIQSDRVIMWGGRPYTEVDSNNIWIYDYNSNSWEQLENQNGPVRRFTYHSIVYDPKVDKTIIFGGVILDSFFGGDLTNEVWSYDLNDNTWELIKQENAPQPRAKQAIVYSQTSDKFVMVGGCIERLYNDSTIIGETWIFSNKTKKWKNPFISN